MIVCNIPSRCVNMWLANKTLPQRIDTLKSDYKKGYNSNTRLDEDVLKTSFIFVFRIRLQDVLIKTFWSIYLPLPYAFKTFFRYKSWSCVFKTSCRNVLKTSLKRLAKTSSRRLHQLPSSSTDFVNTFSIRQSQYLFNTFLRRSV